MRFRAGLFFFLSCVVAWAVVGCGEESDGYGGPALDEWSPVDDDDLADYTGQVFWSDSLGQYVMAQDVSVGFSPDGASWTPVVPDMDPDGSYEYSGIGLVAQCTGTELLAFSGYGYVLRSGDRGESWQQIGTVYSGEFDLNGVEMAAAFSGLACNGARAVGVTRAGTVYIGVRNETFDGTEWDGWWTFVKSEFQFEDGANTVFYDGTRYVAVGEAGLVATSPGGEEWEVLETGLSVGLNDGAVLGDGFVVVGDTQTIAVSEDGLEWLSVPVPGLFERFEKVIVIEERAYVFGVAGAVVVVEGGEVVHSESIPLSGDLVSVASDGETFVATTVADGVLIYPDVAD